MKTFGRNKYKTDNTNVTINKLKTQKAIKNGQINVTFYTYASKKSQELVAIENRLQKASFNV